jgi:hypothetical protein
MDGLRHSHTVNSRVVLLNTDGSERAEFRVVDGSLTIDGRRNVWRQVDVTVAAKVPSDILLIDSRSTIRVERGIRYFDKTEEWVSVGVFKVQKVNQRWTGETADITAFDFGAVIDDYRLVLPYAPYDSDSNPLTSVTAIEELVATSFANPPLVRVDSAINTGQQPPAGTVFTGSRWDAIQSLSKGLGAVLHANVDGSFRLRVVDQEDDPVWRVNAGDGGVLVEVSSVRDRAEQYNAVPVRWETPDSGGLAFVVDDDPLSPTFWNGPFGRKPLEEQQITTVSNSIDAVVAAAGLLQQYKGFTRSVSFQSVANPLLEPFDVISLEVGRFREDHVVDSIRYNLGRGTMDCETRLVRESTPGVTP